MKRYMYLDKVQIRKYYFSLIQNESKWISSLTTNPSWLETLFFISEVTRSALNHPSLMMPILLALWGWLVWSKIPPCLDNIVKYKYIHDIAQSQTKSGKYFSSFSNLFFKHWKRVRKTRKLCHIICVTGRQRIHHPHRNQAHFGRGVISGKLNKYYKIID